MFEIVLYEPEIPPNTGNAIRLAANTGCHLHLIRPLGFNLSDKQLARAGLDYHDLTRVTVHENLSACRLVLEKRRWFAFSTHARSRYDQTPFQVGDVLLFGPETRGLPPDVRNSFAMQYLLRLPMAPANRSLNLSNTIAVVVYEAWRQCGFNGAV